MADGYWYFYDHPMDGPPEVVSDIEYADPSAAALTLVIQRPPVCVGPVCL
jgi:hypothetical protein